MDLRTRPSVRQLCHGSRNDGGVCTLPPWSCLAGWVLIRRRLFLFVLAVVVSACSSDGPDVESVAEPAAQVAPETTTTTTTTTTTSTTTTTEPPPTIEECLAEVPLDVKLGQLLFPVMTQSEFGAATVLAANGQIAGVVVLGSPDARVARDIEAMQTTSLVGPSIIAVDEEGGRVQRLDDLVGTLPSARAMANGTPAEVRAQSRSHAEAIGALGFTMNLAPVLDLDNGTYIRDRSFGADAATVEEYAFAFADGILDAGLTPTAKHFPGHGRGTDSHTGLPTLPGLDELRGTDLQPFVAGEEVVEHRRVRAGAEIEQHEVGGQLPQLAHEAHAAQVTRLRLAQVRMRRGDQLKAGLGRLDEQLREIVFALRDEVGERDLRRLDAEAGVEVRALEIGVDRHDPMTHARERGREIDRDEGLAAALGGRGDRDA